MTDATVNITLREFIDRLQSARASDAPILSASIRALGDPAVSALATTIKVGTTEQVNVAVTIAISAYLTPRPTIQDALIAVLERADTFLHELGLPQLIELAVNHSVRAGNALKTYVDRSDSSCARRYAAILNSMDYNPRKHKLLPNVRIVEVAI